MLAAERTSRFHVRIARERKILAVVNRAFGSDGALVGLTAAAIESWAARASRGGRDVASVRKILLEISKRAQLLADDSKEVFTAGVELPRSGTDELEVLLEKELVAFSAS